MKKKLIKKKDGSSKPFGKLCGSLKKKRQDTHLYQKIVLRFFVKAFNLDHCGKLYYSDDEILKTSSCSIINIFCAIF